MASRSGRLTAQKSRRVSTRTLNGKKPQGICKATRRSDRIHDKNEISKPRTNSRQIGKQENQTQAARVGKRTRDHENPTSLERPTKRSRVQDPLQTKESHKHTKEQRRSYPSLEQSTKQPQKLGDSDSHISYWATKQIWPEDYFKSDNMHRLLARKRSTASLGRKRSNSSLTGASDEKPREEKSAPYRNPSYPTFLNEDVDEYKSYMEDHPLGLSDASRELLDKLLHSPQSPPKGTLFRDDIFKKHLSKLKGKNESRILQDLSPLLVPSAEALASLGAEHLDGIVESVNEGWNNCRPITKPRPQPDSAHGYGTSPFSADRLNKLRPTLGDASFSSYFKATYYMYFPFLTKEVKTGTMGLGIADNQNAHSMTIAVRGPVELFKFVGREHELHREIVAFAISHDDESVRIYAYYPFIDGDQVTIWRHTAARYYFDLDTRWRSWTFTTNVYDIFSPMHLKRICSAIDDIPSDLTVSRESEIETQSSESSQQLDSSQLSRQLENHRLNTEPEVADSQPITPGTSVQTGSKSPKRKKTKKKDNNALSHHQPN